jgi:hypothetical protein
MRKDNNKNRKKKIVSEILIIVEQNVSIRQCVNPLILFFTELAD